MTTILILDKEIEAAFTGADYGGTDPREVIKTGLLKVVCGYHNGYTTTCILKDLGLTTKKGNVTSKGREYLYAAFQEHLKH